jgi:hypothetical protein
MGGKLSDLSALDLGDVRDRLYGKYEVTPADADLAIEYLRCFLHARRVQPTKLIILPQIADWAWHELILDTVCYRRLCSEVFGYFLHHFTTTIDFDELSQTQELHVRDLIELNPAWTLPRMGFKYDDLGIAFTNSLTEFRAAYGLSLGEKPDEWLQAGWNNPAYRLRHPIQLSCSDWEHLALGRTARKQEQADSIFSWLPGRIVQRHNLTAEFSQRAVAEYSALFFSLRSKPNLPKVGACSILARAAWEEHILWTRRYADDCRRVLGFFLDHSPREYPSGTEHYFRNAPELHGQLSCPAYNSVTL